MSELRAEFEADIFNKAHPPGTPVTVRRDSGEVLETVTRSEAWVLCGSAVVLVKGISGGYRLNRVTPLSTKGPADG